MRFMIIRKADSDTEAGAMASEELITDMAMYVQEMVDAGVMLVGDGLKPSSKGARVKFSGGKPKVIDGPFTEAKELVAGYSIIDVASKEEAIEWVKRWPVSDGNGEVEIEIRELYEVEELGSGEGIEHHVRLREQMSNR
jgi:PhnB protein